MLHAPYIAEKHKLFPDWWWRFDKYQVADGRIQPAAGARLSRYEPWDDYRAPEGKEPIRQPYHTLLELIARIQSGELDGKERDAEIIAWATTHGLLGVLPHISETITFPISEFGRQRGVLRYVRETRGWRQEQYPGDSHEQGGALVRQLGGFGQELQKVETTWGRFFSRERIPTPFSPEFWMAYSEPIETFIAAGTLLFQATEQLRKIQQSRKALPQKQEEFISNVEQLIHSLTVPVRPMVYLERWNRYDLGWSCGSLLSDFAMMVVLDFTKNRLLTCQNPKCRAFFVTKSTAAKYCSARCRGTVQMRKYRSNRKEFNK